MKAPQAPNGTHPPGESTTAAATADPELVIDTPGGRYRAVFDDATPVSALGPLVFFAQFLRAGGRFDALCADTPLEYRSPNAPPVRLRLQGHHPALEGRAFRSRSADIIGWAGRGCLLVFLLIFDNP